MVERKRRKKMNLFISLKSLGRKRWKYIAREKNYFQKEFRLQQSHVPSYVGRLGYLRPGTANYRNSELLGKIQYISAVEMFCPSIGHVCRDCD